VGGIPPAGGVTDGGVGADRGVCFYGGGGICKTCVYVLVVSEGGRSGRREGAGDEVDLPNLYIPDFFPSVMRESC
jgi:hypothetical protein